MNQAVIRFFQALWDVIRWRYGLCLGGRIARKHRFLGYVQLRRHGIWRTAHPNWRKTFRAD